MKRLDSILYPMIFVSALAVLIEILVRQGFISDYLLPTPSSVIEALFTDRDEFQVGLFQTAFTAISGWLLAIFFGLLIASLMTLSDWAQKTFYPIANFFQTVPLIAIAPLLVIWFGFGALTVIVSAFIVSVFPVIANTFAGLRSVDKSHLDLFRLYNSSPWKTFALLRLPSAVPQIIVGSRIAIGLALIGSIVGEFIASGGLGGIIDSSRTQQRMDRVFASVLTTSLLGILLVVAFDFLTQILFKKWKAHREN
jgi:NitT/TauT family transport system permease protein